MRVHGFTCSISLELTYCSACTCEVGKDSVFEFLSLQKTGRCINIVKFSHTKSQFYYVSEERFSFSQSSCLMLVMKQLLLE